MSQSGLDRRAFLRNAGLTALAGAVTTGAPPVAFAASRVEAPNGKYDFDTIYNRFGTDSTKFDQQIAKYGKDSIQVGMGIADMDFRAAPLDHQGAERAHAARELGLPGYDRRPTCGPTCRASSIGTSGATASPSIRTTSC